MKIGRLLRKIQQFAQCSPKKRGRPVKAENIKDPKRESNKGNLCEQKRQRDGEIIYYNTVKGKSKKAGSLSRLKKYKKKIREQKKAEKQKTEKTKTIKSKKSPEHKKLEKAHKKLLEKFKKAAKRIKELEEMKNVGTAVDPDKIPEKEVTPKKEEPITDQEYKKIQPKMKEVYEKLVSKKHLSHVLDFPEYYKGLQKDFPDLSIPKFKEILDKLCGEEKIDLHSIDSKGKEDMSNPFYIRTSLGELYYVSWR